MTISYGTLKEVAYKAASDMGNMPNQMPTKAVIAEFDKTACCLQIVDLVTEEFGEGLAKANGHSLTTQDVRSLLPELLEKAGPNADLFVFKCIRLESGAEYLVHWDLHNNRERKPFGRTIRSDPE